MSTKRKAPAKLAQPVARRNAKQPLKSQINESDAAVTVAQFSKADNPGASEAIIEISSDAESSEYELEDEPDKTTEPIEHAGPLRTAESSSVKPSSSGDADVTMAESNAPGDADSDQELAQPTLGELARAHGTIDVPASLIPQSNAITTKRTLATPSHSSLGTVLSQALRTDDTDLLESCLHVKEYQTINNTVQRLESTLAGVLLSKLATRMHRRPGRAGSLMSWVQATLVCHGGALAAQPGLVKRLSELQRVLDERSRGLNSLLALKGKLDLMNSQMKLRRQQRNADSDDEEADEEDGMIYVEGEDSDAEVANGLVDDDDELPVTNGIMDEDSEDDDLPSQDEDDEEELDGEEELDEDEVNHEDVESEDEDSEPEAAPQRPSKRTRTSRGR
ncbi:NUC189-domain-containing protein [Xylariaceae sp. FL1272]|nr:NUC189-domain-containing protein [Xylariaceae sp. FL1272]